MVVWRVGGCWIKDTRLMEYREEVEQDAGVI